MGNTQKLSIRLLREGLEPHEGFRRDEELRDYTPIENAKILTGTFESHAPRWATFLALDEEDEFLNITPFCILFLSTNERWFAISFGMGHAKLDPVQFEQDFGLRVVLNSVDPRKLKSTDIRTPDENTLSKRSQTSRGSDQTAFAIDIERDIVRGLAGQPRDTTFASRVSGTDALALDRKLVVTDLPKVCSDAYTLYRKFDYKGEFGWIDQVRHIRDDDLIDRLDQDLVTKFDNIIAGTHPNICGLAFPVIYNPDYSADIRYKGFGSRLIFPELDIDGYISALKAENFDNYTVDDLNSHTVHEVDDDGADIGYKWRIRDSFVYETNIEGGHFVLSGGRWYKVDADLVKEAQAFYDSVDKVDLPTAEEGENEETYNERVKFLDADMICLDRKLIKVPGASSRIEFCDFLTRAKWFVHIKDETSSSRLSHLFNQGTVSARVLATTPSIQDDVIQIIRDVQAETGQQTYDNILSPSTTPIVRGDFTIVFGVISAKTDLTLPFFSLISLRQAARELRVMGFKYAFGWITKPSAPTKGKLKRKKKEITQSA